MLSAVIEKFYGVLDLVYPQICAGCDKVAIRQSEIFCIDCLSNLSYTEMEDMLDNEFEKHFKGRATIEQGMSLFYFTKGGVVQRAIHHLKYSNRPDIGYALGKLLGRKLLNSKRFHHIDLITSVPLHKKKLYKRGYNQSDFLCRGVSTVMNIPFEPGLIRRVQQTYSQTRRSRVSRMQNMKDSFEVNQIRHIQGKHVLLIDDVLTTGATLDFCCQALSKGKSAKVSMATIAMGSQL